MLPPTTTTALFVAVGLGAASGYVSIAPRMPLVAMHPSPCSLEGGATAQQARLRDRRLGAGGLMAAQEDGGVKTPPKSEPTGNGAASAVLLLLALNAVSQWARAIIFYVVDFKVEPSAEAERLFMNVDLGFDEAQYGVLASIGFAALFSVTSLAAGSIVERVDARSLLVGTAGLWSVATIFQGAAQGFGGLLGARMAAGIGQAFGNPASYTILSRLYPPDKLASVNGLYASGVYVGGGLAALSILVDSAVGWRQLCIFAGGVGLVVAAGTQLRLPPLPALPPAAADGAPSPSAAPSSTDERSKLLAPKGAAPPAEGGVLASLGALLSEPTVSLLLLASAFRFLAGFTIGVWIVPYYREAYPGAIGAQFALVKAAVNGLAGSASATGGGVLADRLAKRDPRFLQWVPAAGSLLGIPMWIATIQAESLEASLGFLFLECLAEPRTREAPRPRRTPRSALGARTTHAAPAMRVRPCRTGTSSPSAGSGRRWPG